MAGTVFDEFAQLYNACRKAGIAAPVADQMEIWEIAAQFGLATPAEQKDPDDNYRGNRPSTLPKGIKQIPGSAELVTARLMGGDGG